MIGKLVQKLQNPNLLNSRMKMKVFGKVKKKEQKIPDSGQRCPNYKYTITQILISVKCFLNSSAGFRGLSSVFQTLKEFIISIATPAHTTIRNWLLKIGLYKLERPKH